MAVKNAVYKVDNGNGEFDEIHLKTKAAQVFMDNGVDLESGFHTNKSLNGYTTLPNGLLMQWGYINSGNQTHQVNFPINYSSPNSYIIVATPYTGESADGLDFKTFSTTEAGIRISSTKVVAFYWMTIGW